MPPAAVTPGEDPGYGLLWSKSGFPVSWTASWGGTLGEWVRGLVLCWIVSYFLYHWSWWTIPVVCSCYFHTTRHAPTFCSTCRSVQNLRIYESHICHLLCTYCMPGPARMCFSLSLLFILSVTDLLSLWTGLVSTLMGTKLYNMPSSAAGWSVMRPQQCASTRVTLSPPLTGALPHLPSSHQTVGIWTAPAFGCCVGLHMTRA